MEFLLNNDKYEVVIERKKKNKNTYLRVKDNKTILITCPWYVREKDIVKVLDKNKKALLNMIEKKDKKNKDDTKFLYLGKVYDIVYTTDNNIFLGNEKIFLPKNVDLDLFYKKQSKSLFLEHLDKNYSLFSRKIPYPNLKIRKMKSRWGVCNTKTKTITLNTELMKYDLIYLDYVIVHELSHLVYPNHQKEFWHVVEENIPNYKKIRKEMKDF